jgi:biopolymer transport protein ExbD
MKLFMPDDTGDPMNIKETGALTLLPAEKGTVYYYEGQLVASNFKKSNLHAMRDLILNKKARTNEKDFFVVIKPADQSNYGDLVKVLDEMNINEVKRYSIGDITKAEMARIKIEF